MFLTMVYARDGAGRVGLEDAILRTSKDVAAVNNVGSDTRHTGGKVLEVGRREAKLELLRTRPWESLAYIGQSQLQSCDRSSSRSLS